MVKCHGATLIRGPRVFREFHERNLCRNAIITNECIFVRRVISVSMLGRGVIISVSLLGRGVIISIFMRDAIIIRCFDVGIGVNLQEREVRWFIGSPETRVFILVALARVN